MTPSLPSRTFLQGAMLLLASRGPLQGEAAPAESWAERLGRTRGLFLMVEPQPGWAFALQDPRMEDLAEELTVEATRVKDPMLARFGIPGTGAYLLNEAGRVVGAWKTSSPSDLRAAFAEVGWISRAEELERQIKQQGDRVDLHGRLVTEHWRRASRRPVSENLDRLARSLDRLLQQPGWWAQRLPRLPLLLPPVNAREPLRLRDLARNRLEEVREVLRQDPESQTAWGMLAFLSLWSPGEEPRLHRFLETLPLPSARYEELLDWPGEFSHAMAELQLRRLGDWAGMEIYAQARVDRLLEVAATLAPEPPSQWAVRLGVGETQHRGQPPAAPFQSLPFAQTSARALGRWLLLLLEAQLAQEKMAPAAGTISILLRDGDPRSWREARGLLAAAKADHLVRQLDSGAE